MGITREQREVSHCLQAKAAAYLGDIPNINSALRTFAKRPGPINLRIAQFCNVADHFARMTNGQDYLERDQYPHVLSLRELNQKAHSKLILIKLLQVYWLKVMR